MSAIKQFREWLEESRRTTGDGWEPRDSWVHENIRVDDLEVGATYTWSDSIGTSRRVTITGMKWIPDTRSWLVRFTHVDSSIQGAGTEKTVIHRTGSVTAFEDKE